MAWARVTSATLGANAGSTASPWNAGNLGAAVSAGNRLFAAITYDSATGSPHVSAVSDSVNGAWTNMLVLASTGSAQMEWSLWSVISGAGTPSSISITFAGGTGGMGIGVSVGAYSGLSSSTDGSEIDVSKISFHSTHASALVDSGTTSGTTTAANELKLGLYGDFGIVTTITAGTLDTTYTIFAKSDTNGNTQTAIEDADSGTSGSTARATLSGTATSYDETTAVAVIKLAGGAASKGPPARMRRYRNYRRSF